MNIPVTINLQAILEGETARAEMFDRLVCEPDFMDGLIELLVDGATRMSSWPTDHYLSTMRERLLAGFGAHTEAELVARERSAEERRSEAQRKVWDMERRIKSLSDLVKRANLTFHDVEKTDEGPVTEVRFTVQHRGNEGCSCDACHLIKYLRKSEVPA
jgi:hypothetical protein